MSVPRFKSPSQSPRPVPHSRSLGLKLIVVCALVILMAIPAMFISYVSFERSQRADDVTRDVAARYGGEQYVSGPILVAPYGLTNAEGKLLESGQYVIFPETGIADFAGLTTTLRKRSLFKVPTYEGEGVLSANFAAISDRPRQPGQYIDWSQAKIMIGLTDPRGLKRDVKLTLPDGTKRQFEPESGHLYLGHFTAKKDLSDAYQHRQSLPMRSMQKFMSVPAADLVAAGTDFSVAASLTLAGATRLGVMPFAKSTTARISADWADPGFEGGFPPTTREISETGFAAEWSVPFLARGMASEGTAHTLPFYDVSRTAMTVRFVATHNPYQTVNRALKYAVMFIGLVFIAYFLFEVMVGMRVHPAQYILIGLAQSIFYLLLLAFSERVGFSLAFLIAASATVGASSAYAGAMFGDRSFIAKFGCVFTLVYVLLFALMRMQDFALMMGALTGFFAITGTMYLTRNVDWYGLSGAQKSPG